MKKLEQDTKPNKAQEKFGRECHQTLKLQVRVFCNSRPTLFPGGVSDKEPACQCRRCKRHGFDPWAGKIPWRKAWQHTPVFLIGESHGQRSLAGYSPSDHTELDMTQATQHVFYLENIQSYTTAFQHFWHYNRFWYFSLPCSSKYSLSKISSLIHELLRSMLISKGLEIFQLPFCY